MHIFREPGAPWLPHHRYGSPAEGGWKDQNGHHAVCRQRKPGPRDNMVQGHAACGHQQQQRAHETASFRYNLILSDLISSRCYSPWHTDNINMAKASHEIPTDTRHEDDVDTLKAFGVMYDFAYSRSSQRTWTFYSKCVTLIGQLSSYWTLFLTAAAHFKVTQKSEWSSCISFDSDAWASNHPKFRKRIFTIIPPNPPLYMQLGDTEASRLCISWDLNLEKIKYAWGALCSP